MSAVLDQVPVSTAAHGNSIRPEEYAGFIAIPARHNFSQPSEFRLMHPVVSMHLPRRLSPLLLVTLLCLAPLSGNAQANQPNNALLLQSMASLGAHANFHTDFTFDKSMLQELAGGLPDDEYTQNTLNRLDSITVHIFHYSQPGMYVPTDLEGLRAYYRAPGWNHLVAAQPANTEGRTDLWVLFEHDKVESLTLLVAKPTSLNIVEVHGNLSPLDILHLRGHFGIPRFTGDHFIDPTGQPFAAGSPH